MATTQQGTTLQELAQRHLWMHFSRMGAYDRGAEVPIIVRGDGCYVWDEHGNRYLDGLSALFCVNIGHGRADVAQAGADQAARARLLHELVLRAPARDRAGREDRLARARRPQPRLLHLRRRRGGRVGAQARPPVPQAHGQPEQDEGHRARDRLPRHDARARFGAPGITAPARSRSSRSRPAAATCPNTNLYRLAPGYGAETLAEAVAHRIEFEGPETVAAVILEPVQNAGGCFIAARGLLPARARDLRRATTCCSSPTRSSARGAASASGSARSATATSRTSSRRPRASPPPTRRWAR